MAPGSVVVRDRSGRLRDNVPGARYYGGRIRRSPRSAGRAGAAACSDVLAAHLVADGDDGGHRGHDEALCGREALRYDRDAHDGGGNRDGGGSGQVHGRVDAVRRGVCADGPARPQFLQGLSTGIERLDWGPVAAGYAIVLLVGRSTWRWACSCRRSRAARWLRLSALSRRCASCFSSWACWAR